MILFNLYCKFYLSKIGTMDRELLNIARSECGLKVNRILQEETRVKEYKLYNLYLCLGKIEEEFQGFKEKFISKFGLNNDQAALYPLHKICLVNAKDCVTKLMCLPIRTEINQLSTGRNLRLFHNLRYAFPSIKR